MPKEGKGGRDDWEIIRAYMPGYVIVRGKSMFTESYETAKACAEAWNKEKKKSSLGPGGRG